MVDDKDKKPAVHIPSPPAPGHRVSGGMAPTGQVQPTHSTEADPHAAEENRKAAERQAETPAQFTPEQLATPAPQLAGSRQMYVIVGPYKGSVLTMPDDEAENAKDNHWAVEMDTVAPPFDADNPPDHDHELTDEDRANAVKEANEWAAKVNPPPEPPPPEGGEGGVTKGGKAVNPAPAGGYETRTAPTKK
jgi:hypothetical protein